MDVSNSLTMDGLTKGRGRSSRVSRGLCVVVLLLLTGFAWALSAAPRAEALTSSFCGYLRYSGQHCVDPTGVHSWNLVQNTYPSSSTLEYLCVSAYTAAGSYKQPRRGD